MGSGGAQLGHGPRSKTLFGPSSSLGHVSFMGNPQPLLHGGIIGNHNVAKYFHFLVKCFCSVSNNFFLIGNYNPLLENVNVVH
jgi:hypothetical protein